MLIARFVNLISAAIETQQNGLSEKALSHFRLLIPRGEGLRRMVIHIPREKSPRQTSII